MAQSTYIPAIPLKWPLLISLALAWCWSQIAWSIGMSSHLLTSNHPTHKTLSGANALAKSHRDKNYIKQRVGPAATLYFHTQGQVLLLSLYL